jgi:glycosyltransferase involved in cell wall biosynthesis
MRVAVDVTALHDARTGVGVVTHELLSRLAARPDLDVVAYSVSWHGRHAAADLVGPGVTVATRPMAARPLRLAWRHGDHPVIERFTGPVDVVFGPNFVVPPARRAARVALVHDLTAWRFPELCTRDTLEYPALVQRAVATGAHVVTPTRAVAEEVRAVTGAAVDRVHPVHWAPSGDAPGDPADGRRRAGAERYLLALGTIEPRKDHVTLVQAFDLVADDDPDVVLVVAGPDGWGVEAFDAAVASARHQGRIRRLGWVDDDVRADLLAGAAAFVYPSRYEGFGLPPLEAMAAGAPVVASAVPALEEVLGHAAVLVAPDDAEALAAGVRRATGGGRSAIVAAGRERAASFSWDRAADGVVDALRAAVSRPATTPS